MHCLRADYWEKGYSVPQTILNVSMIVVDGSGGSLGALKRVALSAVFQLARMQRGETIMSGSRGCEDLYLRLPSQSVNEVHVC
jgi:hypothetical protein